MLRERENCLTAANDKPTVLEITSKSPCVDSSQIRSEKKGGPSLKDIKNVVPDRRPELSTSISTQPEIVYANQVRVAKARADAIKEADASGTVPPPLAKAMTNTSKRSAPTHTSVRDQKRYTYRACVGDWRCGLYRYWNKLVYERCRGQNEKCEGHRSEEDTVLQVQEDDGKAEHNRMGNFLGDWWCGCGGGWNYARSDNCQYFPKTSCNSC